MFLEQLEIENIRSLPQVKLDLVDTASAEPMVRKWSLLVGENGTGKSTLLKACALLLAGTEALPHLVGTCDSWVRHGATSGRIRAKIRTADWELREVSLEIHRGDTPRDMFGRNHANMAPLDDAIERATQNYFLAAYGPYRRVSEEGQFNFNQRFPHRAQSIITLFDKNAVVNPLPAWAMSLEYRRGAEGLELVREAMNALMPEVRFVGIDKENSTLRFETPDGEVALEELSDGYQNVAAWIGDLLYRVTDSFAHQRNPLNARGLLLIDEIDAHLHPAWQRRLREFLTSKLPNFQILATTHSALTLQQAHEGEATILSRDENQLVRARDFPGDPSKLRLHQLYELAFGINSLDSWEIEQSKDTYRALVSKDDLTGDEERQLAEAKATLEAVPTDRDDSLGNEALDRFFTKLDQVADNLARRTSEG